MNLFRKKIYLMSGLFIFLVLVNIVSAENKKSLPSYTSEDTFQNILKIKSSNKEYKIHIIGNQGWADFKSAGNCTGSGSYGDPYVIEDIEIDAEYDGSPIYIQHSTAYFRIENCTLYNSEDSIPRGGVCLNNVSNGHIFKNNLSNNPYRGVILFIDCTNITIEENLVENCRNGILIGMGSNNTVKNNIVRYNVGATSGTGIVVLTTENNTIFNNTVIYNSHNGIWVEESSHNFIIDNNLSFNEQGDGISIWTNSYNNSLIGNTIVNNGKNGIYLGLSDNQTVRENLIEGNKDEAVKIDSDSHNNIFYMNIFKKHTTNVADSSMDNNWNTTSIGNYWDDYTGVDLDNDLIGDTEYSFSGGTDYFPMWNDGPYLINESTSENWIKAKQWGWCTGEGSLESPYIIENINVNGNNSDVCITIADSNESYFIIDNCTVINSTASALEAGLKIVNSSKGTILNNTIIDNNGNGLLINDSSDLLLYNNYFENNSLNHAVDNGTNNNWNNTIIGNYWDNYSGVDENDDGIGETSYLITGTGGGIDYLPIWDDGANGSVIYIDDNSWNNWSWAETKTWCSGSGSINDPYVIKDETLHSGITSYCIKIENSDANFTIEKCNLEYSEIGIILNNTKNGIIYNNSIRDFQGANNGGKAIGIYLLNSSSILVVNNTIYNLTGDSSSSGAIGGFAIGISLTESNETQIVNNTISNITGGIGGGASMFGSGGHGGNGVGTFFQNSYYNTLHENLIYDLKGGKGGTVSGVGSGGSGGDGVGIYFLDSKNNTINSNLMFSFSGGEFGTASGGNPDGWYGVEYGIFLESDSYQNNISTDNLYEGDPILYFYGRKNIAINDYVLNSSCNPTNLGKIALIECVNITVFNNTLENYQSGPGKTKYMAMSYSGYDSSGIYILNSYNNSIYNNTISYIEGGRGGTGGVYSSGGVGGIGAGFYLLNSENNKFYNNTISHITGGHGGEAGSYGPGGIGGVGTAFYFSASNNNTLYKNTISNIEGGTGGTTLMFGPNGMDERNFGCFMEPDSYQNNITLDNTIEGESIIYLYDQEDVIINGFNLSFLCNPTNLGKITIIKCNNINISSNIIDNFYGRPGNNGYNYVVGRTGYAAAAINISDSYNIIITNNNITNVSGGQGGTGANGRIGGLGGNGIAISLENSLNITIENNIISFVTGGTGGTGDWEQNENGGIGGDGFGILLSNINDSIIEDNYIYNISRGLGGDGGGSGSDGSDGISIGLLGSINLGCVISHNYISNCTGNSGYGIQLSSNSDSNNLYCNYFVGNDINALDDGDNNNWTDGYIGNYFDDYSGSDLNPVDGIGDTNYTVSGTSGSNDTKPILFLRYSDFDGDGLTNIEEYILGLDGYRTNVTNPDSENDGLSDYWEYRNSTDPWDPDCDDDGLLDGEERTLGVDNYITNATNADSDLDGLSDYWEYDNSTDPWDPDCDDDGFLDGEERTLGVDNYITNATNADSDLDGLSDYWEYGNSTDPWDPDCDGDNILDGEECILGDDGYITNATNPDSDGDTFNDDIEIGLQTQPLDNTWYPMPNLVAERFSIADTIEGQAFLLNFTIKNNGIWQASNLIIKIRCDILDITLYDNTASPLTLNVDEPRNILYSCKEKISKGRYAITLRIDPDNLISELYSNKDGSLRTNWSIDNTIQAELYLQESTDQPEEQDDFTFLRNLSYIISIIVGLVSGLGIIYKKVYQGNIKMKRMVKDLSQNEDLNVRFKAVTELYNSKKTNRQIMMVLGKVARDEKENEKVRNLARAALEKRGLLVDDR